jgi:hypothetical protein
MSTVTSDNNVRVGRPDQSPAARSGSRPNRGPWWWMATGLGPIPLRSAAVRLWMHVVSMASAWLMVGRMVVSRRASIDFPAPGGPSIRTFGSERLHYVQLCIDVFAGTWAWGIFFLP